MKSVKAAKKTEAGSFSITEGQGLVQAPGLRRVTPRRKLRGATAGVSCLKLSRQEGVDAAGPQR